MPHVIERVLSEEVLEKTMTLFWEKGYFSVSIEDIIEATGFNRAAIYKHFGGKDGLFLAMLNRYRNHVTEMLTAPLQNRQDNGLGLHNIKFFFQSISQLYRKNCLSKGCFLIATASDIPSHDARVVKFIGKFIQHLRTLFLNNVDAAARNGQLKYDGTSCAIADFLVGNVFGLFTLCRSKAPKIVFENQLAGIMDFVESITSVKRVSKL